MSGKVESLPWSESSISSEANVLTSSLIDLNSRGLLTINSQPAVDGVKSSHPVYGWGPKNGYVYQKAYLEVLVSPELIDTVISRMDKDEDITYYAVNNTGELRTNAPTDGGPNAVTWGVFPGKEIVQPTIVETVSFLAWRDEFYHLGSQWSKCYNEDTPSRQLITEITESWYLVNIVHNDFRNTTGIFPLFDGLRVSGLDSKPAATTNGHSETKLNGGSTLDDAGPKPELEGVPDLNNAVNGASDAAASAKTNGEVKN